MTEDPVVKISDNVIVDSTINLGNVTCPSCGASGSIRRMPCQSPDCEAQFCDLCHINCKYSEEGVLRFDSADGSGPFCKECLSSLEREKRERLEEERERLEEENRERLEEERRENSVKFKVFAKATAVFFGLYVSIVFIVSWLGFAPLEPEGSLFWRFFSNICCSIMILAGIAGVLGDK